MTTDSTSIDTARTTLTSAVAAALEGRELLSHPFYRRWEAGLLAPGELAEYAVHYRAFEAALPVVLEAVVERLRAEGDVDGATLVERNLDDELGRPEPHLALFDRFAAALPETPSATAAGPAAADLVATYRELVETGPEAALAGLAAYESQASAVARTKADGLRRWYGVDTDGAEFWEVHAALDAAHGEWAVDALVHRGADPDAVTAAATKAAVAWWAFLDEREAEAPCSAELGADD